MSDYLLFKGYARKRGGYSSDMLHDHRKPFCKVKMGKETKSPTSFINRNPKRKLFGLWYVVDDYESAKEAANLANYISAGLLGIGIFVLFSVNEILYKPDDFDSFLPQLAKFLQLVIPIWFVFRLHKEKYGMVPWIAIIGAI